MKILSIETSCDETGVCVLECIENTLSVLGNALASQIDLHAQYGGVFPALAKRAHTEKIIPLLKEALISSNLLYPEATSLSSEQKERIEEICKHEQGLAAHIISFAEAYATPSVDHIAVTAGPGLEPALWVGINAAQALSFVWQKPLFPINHMEGHIISAVFAPVDEHTFSLRPLSYPALALLVSGGHTELVLIEKPHFYKKIGQTLDDAVGEAFDKVARILGLPYPGGPKISLLAKEAREEGVTSDLSLPRPMLHSGNYDFSYSGLKTAVLYATKDKMLSETQKKAFAREFEEAAIEVLVKKTLRAIEEYGVQTLIVGGGVAANTYLKKELEEKIGTKYKISALFPTKALATDNAVMIGMASFYEHESGTSPLSDIKANGNWSIETEK